MATVVPMPLPGVPGELPSASPDSKRSNARVDLSMLPPESRKALSQLDLDSNGTLDVAEITAAVALLQSTRLFARRLRMLVVGLLIIILLLVCALFGVSYAAAVLAATTKGSSGSSPSLTNTDGTTLRTAAASLPGASFTPAGTAISSTGSRRLQFADEHPSEVFAHRRQLAFAVGANGRQLAVTAASDTSDTPPPLVLVARLNGAAAPGICGLASEGHYDVALPFDPYNSGVKSVVAHFKAPTMLGCDHLDSFGFAADFGVVFASGAEETFWHVDCPPPVTAASACAVSRVYLVPIAPDWTAALSVDSSAVVSVPLEDATASNITARRLAPGVWPPPAISLSATSTACPSISGNDIVTRTGVGSETDTSWKAAILSALPTDPSASAADQAKQACMSSMLCMAGYAVGSGMIFKKDFWTDAYAMSRTMGTAIANNFAQTMSVSNMKSAFATLGGRTTIKCTNYYSSAFCGPNSLPVLTGVTGTGGSAKAAYSCKTWNTADVRVGAIEIASTCANACEVLQWYMSWFKNYRVGSYSSLPIPTWDSTRYEYSQDYCGTGVVSRTEPKYFGGWYSSYVTSSSSGYATHPKCWSGQRIPMCQSFKTLTYSTC